MELVPSSALANGVTILGPTLSGATIVNSTFSGVTIQASTFSGGTVAGSSLSGTTLFASTLTGSTVQGGTFCGITISGTNSIHPYGVTQLQTVLVNRAGAAQTITGSAFVKVQHTTEVLDPSTVYDNATNYRMTPTVSGTYLVVGALNLSGVTGGGVCVSAIYKNGASEVESRMELVGRDAGPTAVGLVVMNGSTDYLEHFVYQDTASTANIAGGATRTYFQAQWTSK